MRNLHQLFAILTISGFVLRAYWSMTASPLLSHRITRIAPHIVDTLFLISGIILVVQLRLPVLQSDWLLAKIAGLVLYIVFGTFALKRGKTRQIRGIAFVGALLAFAYVVNTAITKSPLPW